MATEDELQSFRERFYEKFQTLLSSIEVNKFYMDTTQYNDYIETLKVAREAKSKTSKQYRRLNRFDILPVDGVEKLVSRVTPENPTVKFFIKNEEMFDVLNEAHLALGHGGTQRMTKQLAKKYKNATQAVISIFLKLCPSCPEQKKLFKKEKAKRAAVRTKMNNHCQLHIVDMQSNPDGIYKFIMIYHDNTTKFVQLRALEWNKAEEVTKHLLDIFCIFSAPSTLFMDVDKDFVTHLKAKLCPLWTGLRIIRGKPGNKESVNDKIIQDVQNLLRTWMSEERSSLWSEGVRFVQFVKNRTVPDESMSSPYAATFGCDIKIDLTTSSKSQEISPRIQIVPVTENSVQNSEMNNQTYHIPNIYIY